MNVAGAFFLSLLTPDQWREMVSVVVVTSPCVAVAFTIGIHWRRVAQRKDC